MSSVQPKGPVKTILDDREKKIDYDLQKVDFDWVEKTEDRKELGKAIEALREDGGFPDLLRACEHRLAVLDPAFKRKLDSMKPVSYEAKREIDNEINSFFEDMNKVDRRLINGRGDNVFEGQENKQGRSNKSIEEFERQK
jgi:hypothetical protein